MTTDGPVPPAAPGGPPEVDVVRGADLDAFAFGALEVTDYGAGRGADCSVAVVHVPEGTAHPPAYSVRCAKTYLVLSGRLRFEVRGQVAEVATGDLVRIPAGRRFSYCAVDGGAVVVLVHVPPFDPGAEVVLED